MSQQLEIHINKDGLCKVFQGDARRVFYSTDEAVALALLKMKPGNLAAHIQWADFLPTHGVAFGAMGNKTITLIQSPAKMRTITWSNLDVTEALSINIPPLLWAIKMAGDKLIKTQLWLVKVGYERQLSVTSQAPCLHYFPYGSVYNHGGICWGHVSIDCIKHPAEVEDVFFSSSFNNDLWAPLAIGVVDARLLDLSRRVGGALPTPPAASYTKSVAAIVAEMVK